ncbi:MAG: carboxymuconolactone decarboxylase family protein [Planctomycetota bacterium]
MTTFTIHSTETAPDSSKPLLEKAQQKYGMIPNLMGLMAESPTAIAAYQTLAGLFEKSSFTPTERNIVWLTISYENECHYCMAAHTAIAGSEKVDGEIVEAIRAGEPIADPRLESLRAFTSSLVTNRGWVSGEEVTAFLNAGFTRENVFDVLVGISQKVLSNYSNHLAETAIDLPFQKYAWTKGSAVAG